MDYGYPKAVLVLKDRKLLRHFGRGVFIPVERAGFIEPDLVEPLQKKIFDHYDKTAFGEPDFSKRLLPPNGRLWDLVLTGKEVKEGHDEVLKIEQTPKKWKVVKK